ncbi:MAG: hypothetical protein LBD08_03575 [Treponema sp.]|jgi:hypothetical protein|nr:hypothetical protein [Treponema sp.]
MPITNCVKYRDKLYRYDPELKSIVVYERRKVQPSDCPDSVLLALVSKNENETVVVTDTAVSKDKY